MSRWLMTEDKTKVINSDDIKMVFVTDKNEIMVKMLDDNLRIMATYYDRETAMDVLMNYMQSNTSNFVFSPQKEIDSGKHYMNQIKNNNMNNAMNANWSSINKGPFRR